VAFRKPARVVGALWARMGAVAVALRVEKCFLGGGALRGEVLGVGSECAGRIR
jgi:hypothetical protein